MQALSSGGGRGGGRRQKKASPGLISSEGGDGAAPSPADLTPRGGGGAGQLVAPLSSAPSPSDSSYLPVAPSAGSSAGQQASGSTAPLAVALSPAGKESLHLFWADRYGGSTLYGRAGRRLRSRLVALAEVGEPYSIYFRDTALLSPALDRLEALLPGTGYQWGVAMLVKEPRVVTLPAAVLTARLLALHRLLSPMNDACRPQSGDRPFSCRINFLSICMDLPALLVDGTLTEPGGIVAQQLARLKALIATRHDRGVGLVVPSGVGTGDDYFGTAAEFLCFCVERKPRLLLGGASDAALRKKLSIHADIAQVITTHFILYNE